MVLEFILVPVAIAAMASIKVVNQYERAVVFTLGRYTSLLNPGLNFVIPIIQDFRSLDVRVNATSIPKQETMTKDNISVEIDAVIYYKVEDVRKAIVNIENYSYATLQIAQTTMRQIIGETTLDDLLAKREEISKKIFDLVSKPSHQWGVSIQAVELKDIQLPQDLVRIIGKEAEAERESRAVIIKAQGELEAAKNLAKAAKELTQVPGGLHIRMLQTVNNLGNEKSITHVVTTPTELLKAVIDKI